MTTIDARGKACPIPVILAKKEADAGNEQYSVLVDNQTAVENLTRFSGSAGYIPTVTELGSDWSVTLSKSGEGQAEVTQKGSTKSWALFIGREGIGEGDPTLGASLLKMCFYTLTQGDVLPDYILMMNGGVKAAVEHEQAIEHLKELEARGVSVLVCGACLNFFGMTDDLKAGTLSNMYDILTAMQTVDKVISL